MVKLVKFKPEDLEYFKFHYEGADFYDGAGDEWDVYIDMDDIVDGKYVAITVRQEKGYNATIELPYTNDSPAALIPDLRQIFSNFDEITLIGEDV